MTMSNDPLDGLLGTLSGGKDGFGKILQDLLGTGASAPQGGASDKANISMPDDPSARMASPGQPSQPMGGAPGQPMGGQPGMRDPTSGVTARPMPPGPTGRTSPAMPTDRGNFSDLLERFRKAGLGNQVDSWVSGDKANESITPGQVNNALGPQQVQNLARTAEVSPDEISQGLAQALPEVVNELTPQGHMPTQGEVQASLKRLIG
jgi:uncharacterized protein YidB (DUF937 family)